MTERGRRDDPKSQLLFSGISLSLCCCNCLVNSLCGCDHVWIISANPACKSNIVLPPNWGQHLCSSCHVTAHSSSKAPQPPNLKRETDVKSVYSLFFIHCKAYHGMKKPSPIQSRLGECVRGCVLETTSYIAESKKELKTSSGKRCVYLN